MSRGILLGLGLALFAASVPHAAPRQATPASAQLKEKRSDLGELRQRIEQLKKNVGAAESARNEAADQLREQERGISESQRELHELSAERDVLQQRIAELGRETRQAETQLSAQQTQLERVLVRQYMTGTPGPLRLLLSGQNPNQIARDFTYLQAIGQARQQLARQASGMIDQKRLLSERAQQESAALEALETRRKAQQEKMLAQREERKLTLARLAGRLDAQRREIETLRRDEQRLSRLVARLDKLLAARAKAAKSARPKAAKAPPPKRPGRPAAPAGADPADDSGSEGANLARLKGRLPSPVAGSIGLRFGAPLDGGMRSKGIFVRAPNGAPVQAIAAGQVVFADWMRGFGNLLVLDHGGGFLSIYGYNEAVLKEVGVEVRGGETIAAAGNSGGRSETGLYFELRRKGEPLDPGQWLKR